MDFGNFRPGMTLIMQTIIFERGMESVGSQAITIGISTAPLPAQAAAARKRVQRLQSMAKIQKCLERAILQSGGQDNTLSNMAARLYLLINTTNMVVINVIYCYGYHESIHTLSYRTLWNDRICQEDDHSSKCDSKIGNNQ